ncbi:MAG: NAD(P)H-dependent oxidoreductase [Myroides sp.]|nr:NAD(P)H-dependent oxidoreductase [Myroides sp.]
MTHFRELIQKTDGILISTLKYIFSIPSGLKNALEWCVSASTFINKPLGTITASAHGKRTTTRYANSNGSFYY